MTGSSTPRRRRVGQTAERFAAEVLRRHGYQILETNVRFPMGELDLVAEDQGTLVFVEVRARQPGAFGSAPESVDRRKQRRVCQALESYCLERNVDPARPLRIDVVAIELDRAGRATRAEVIRKAFGET